jgi:salicylate hydroxylase
MLDVVSRKDHPSSDPEASVRAALNTYDLVRRLRAQKQLEQSAELTRMIFFQDAEAKEHMTEILPRLQQGRFDWL